MGEPAFQGKDFRPSASEWNSFRAAARWAANQKLSQQSVGQGKFHPPGLVYIKNTTESDVGRGDVLGIDGPMFDPSDSLDGFRETIPYLLGTTPAVADHKGRFVVALEAIPKEGSGLAIAAGIARVKVNVTSEGIQRCEVKDGDATQLQTDADGSSKILTIEAGTGTKWATVRIADAPPAPPAAPVVLKTFCGYMSSGVDVEGATPTLLPLLERVKTDALYTVDGGAVILPYSGIYLCHYKVLAKNTSASPNERIAAFAEAHLNGGTISGSFTQSDWRFPTSGDAEIFDSSQITKQITLAASFCFNASAEAVLTLKGWSASALGPINFAGGANGAVLTVQYQGPLV